MSLKQISLSMPENLLKATKEYTEELGYRNTQEFILDLIRNKVMLENIDKYEKIEKDMKAGKNVKHFEKEEALEYLKNL